MKSVELIAARIASVSLLTARKKKVTKKKKTKSKPKKEEVSQQEETAQDREFPETDMTKPTSEYSCRVDLSLSVDFEGSIDKARLTKAVKQELSNAIKSSMAVISRSFQLGVSNLQLGHISIDCAVVDHSGTSDFID